MDRIHLEDAIRLVNNEFLRVDLNTFWILGIFILMLPLKIDSMFYDLRVVKLKIDYDIFN